MLVKKKESLLAFFATGRLPHTRSARRAMCPRSRSLSRYSSSPTWRSSGTRGSLTNLIPLRLSALNAPPSMFQATQNANRREALICREKWVYRTIC